MRCPPATSLDFRLRSCLIANTQCNLVDWYSELGGSVLDGNIYKALNFQRHGVTPIGVLLLGIYLQILLYMLRFLQTIPERLLGKVNSFLLLASADLKSHALKAVALVHPKVIQF